MRTIAISAAIFAPLIVPSLQASPIDEALQSVVQVETDNGLGTGFVVGTADTIATNFHVIEGGKEVSCVLANGTRIPVEGFLWADPQYDLALLRTSKPTFLTPLRLSAADREVGAEVFALGSPKGLQGSVSKGVISARRKWIDLKPLLADGISAFGYSMESQWIQTDSAINHGNSGGPLILASGEIVGINTLSAPPDVGQSLGFAIDASHLADALRTAPAKSRPFNELPATDRRDVHSQPGLADPDATKSFWTELSAVMMEFHAALAAGGPDPRIPLGATIAGRDAEREQDAIHRKNLSRLMRMNPIAREAEIQRLMQQKAEAESKFVQGVTSACSKAATKVQVLDSHGVDRGLVLYANDLADLYNATAEAWGSIDRLKQEAANVAPGTSGAAVRLNFEERMDLGIRLVDRVRYMRNIVSEKVRLTLQKRYSLNLPPLTQEEAANAAFGDRQENIQRADDEVRAKRLWIAYLKAKESGGGQKTLKMLVERYPDTTFGKEAARILGGAEVSPDNAGP
jgi:hypothetical protein